MISGLSGSPADTMWRSDGAANESSAARLAIIRYSVGAWQSTATRSDAIRSRRCCGSKRSSCSRQAAPLIQAATNALRADSDQPLAAVHQASSPGRAAYQCSACTLLALQVALRVQRALGPAGRAGGEDDQRRVGGDRRTRQAPRSPGGSASLVDVDHARRLACLRQRLLDGRPIALGAQHQRHVRVVDPLGDLGAGAVAPTRAASRPRVASRRASPAPSRAASRSSSSRRRPCRRRAPPGEPAAASAALRNSAKAEAAPRVPPRRSHAAPRRPAARAARRIDHVGCEIGLHGAPLPSLVG